MMETHIKTLASLFAHLWIQNCQNNQLLLLVAMMMQTQILSKILEAPAAMRWCVC